MPKQSCSATSFSRISSASRQVLILKTGGASTKQWEDEHSIFSQNGQLKKFVRLTMPKLCSFSFCSHFLLLLLPPLCFHLSCDVGPGAQAAKKLWIFGTSGSNGERVLQTAVEGAEAATGCGSVRRGCSLTARLPARHFVIEIQARRKWFLQVWTHFLSIVPSLTLVNLNADYNPTKQQHTTCSGALRQLRDGLMDCVISPLWLCSQDIQASINLRLR